MLDVDAVFLVVDVALILLEAVVVDAENRLVVGVVGGDAVM
jgi:hypothetical protein